MTAKVAPPTRKKVIIASPAGRRLVAEVSARELGIELWRPRARQRDRAAPTKSR